jgi:hypothetical protein
MRPPVVCLHSPTIRYYHKWHDVILVVTAHNPSIRHSTRMCACPPFTLFSDPPPIPLFLSSSGSLPPCPPSQSLSPLLSPPISPSLSKAHLTLFLPASEFEMIRNRRRFFTVHRDFRFLFLRHFLPFILTFFLFFKSKLQNYCQELFLL